MAQTGPREEIAFIHFLRGIAPLFVLVAHIPGWWLLEKQQVWLPFELYKDLIVSPLHLFQHGGHFGVVLFFLISRFIISYVAETEGRSEFCIKRFFRLTPTILIAFSLS